MYLSHFELSGPPFTRPSIADFFYEGANRGATLDALIYVLTHGEGAEGIVRVIGDAGSGKTLLCRSLMKRLPMQMQTIYLGKADMSREEFLHSVASELNLEPAEKSCATAEQAPTVIEELQRLLAEKHAGDGQVVLLIDEAHAMPAETLEAAMTLYGFEWRRHKLFQIVLFGQAELERTLASSRMRKFKNLFAHHFVLQAFDARAVGEYLMCRLHAAGYHGPNIFSPRAARLIARSSAGAIRQLDILADKSMLEASIAGVPEIEAHHVKAALKNSGTEPRFDGESWRNWLGSFSRRVGGASALFSLVAVVALGVLGWQGFHSTPPEVSSLVSSAPLELQTSVPVSVPMPGPVYPTTVATVPSGASTTVPTVPSSASPAVSPAPSASNEPSVTVEPSKPGAATGQRSTTRIYVAGVELAGYELLEQRVKATIKTMSMTDKDSYTIQLFATNNVQPGRMERFLVRARGLIDLSDLYVHPVSNGDQAKFIVTYGIYHDREEANVAVAQLPEKYQSAFQPELYTLSEIH